MIKVFLAVMSFNVFSKSCVSIAITSMIKGKLIEALQSVRRSYDPGEIPFLIRATEDGPIIMRNPIRVENRRHETLVGSIYHLQNHNLNEPSSCVIYLHGNASSQLEGRFLIPNFCPRGVLVCCFDFAGCGRSDGDFWTLGFHEKDDVELLMNELHVSFNVNRFFLWGRSMGAGTSVMVRSPWLKGIIVDSGYSNVPELLKFIGGSKVPGCLLPGGLWVFCRMIKNIAGFDPRKLKPVEWALEGHVPAVFGHSRGDMFVPYDQGRELFDAYECPDKHWMDLLGGHNARRSDQWIRKCIEFVLERSGISYEENMTILRTTEIHEDDHFSSFETMIQNLKDIDEAEIKAAAASNDDDE